MFIHVSEHFRRMVIQFGFAENVMPFNKNKKRAVASALLCNPTWMDSCFSPKIKWHHIKKGNITTEGQTVVF